MKGYHLSLETQRKIVNMCQGLRKECVYELANKTIYRLDRIVDELIRDYPFDPKWGLYVEFKPKLLENSMITVNEVIRAAKFTNRIDFCDNCTLYRVVG